MPASTGLDHLARPAARVGPPGEEAGRRHRDATAPVGGGHGEPRPEDHHREARTKATDVTSLSPRGPRVARAIARFDDKRRLSVPSRSAATAGSSAWPSEGQGQQDQHRGWQHPIAAVDPVHEVGNAAERNGKATTATAAASMGAAARPRPRPPPPPHQAEAASTTSDAP